MRLGFIPADRPRVAVAPDGAAAAIGEPTSITLIALPTCEPRALIEATAATDVGWLGARLLLLARRDGRTRVRVVDPRAPRLVAEGELAGELHLRACVGEHAFASPDDAGAAAQFIACPADAVLARLVRAGVVPRLVGAADARFVAVGDGVITEWDPASAAPRRTWRIPADEQVGAIGGTPRALWRVTRAAPDRIAVIPLVASGQPLLHALPEAIADVAGHPARDELACLGASGRIHVIDLGGAAPPRTLDARPVVAAEAIALVGAGEVAVLAAARATPTTFVPLALPTWRNELVAWTRSGIVDRVPVAPAIAELARALRLPAALGPALTLCYGAYLCGAPGVPPAELDHLLGGRWPDEVRGAGQLSASGALVYTARWIALAPAHRRRLDAVS